MSESRAKISGAPQCGLYIKIGSDYAMDVLTRDLKQILLVINNSAYEKNMHAIELAVNKDDPDFIEKAQSLCAFAKLKGIVPIMADDPVIAQQAGAEGVMLPQPENVAKARELLGDSAIIGMRCGIAPERAAAAFDAEVDYVGFGTGKKSLPSLDALKFWTMLTDKPAVIEGPISNDHCAYYVQAGAGFIDAGDYIWSHPKGVMQGTVNMMHAIDLALAQDTPQTDKMQ